MSAESGQGFRVLRDGRWPVHGSGAAFPVGREPDTLRREIRTVPRGRAVAAPTAREKGSVSNDAIVINGFRLTGLMMSGQTSQVWEVSQEGTGRRYAMKLLLPERAREPEHRKYLEREAKVGLQLQHPKIIKVFEWYPEKENPHFIMELFPSTNLRLRILRKQEAISEHAVPIVEQSAKALAYMHDKGWLHRDIKPDNILVSGTGEVRLIDFALAQRIGGWRLWMGKAAAIQGTRSYMSPEQIRGQKLTERADLYSFGCSLFELFCGRPPFRADSPQALLIKHLKEPPRHPRDLNPALTPEINDLILRLLAKKAEDRPANFHEFLAQFRNIKVLAPAPKSAAKS
jgi:serine/threonine protein kinase